MILVDLDTLLEPLSDADPCGRDLGNDSEYLLLAQSVRSRTGGLIVEDESAADVAAWRQIAHQAAELLQQSKDVWLVGYLMTAAVRTEGLPGLAQGLTLLRQLLERFWEPLHPQRDEEDEYPIQRINAIAELDGETFLRAVRVAPLCETREFGPIRVRDLLRSHGILSRGDGTPEPPEGARLDAAIREAALADVTDLHAATEAIRLALEEIDAIEALQLEHVSRADAAELPHLRTLLKQVQALLPAPAAVDQPGSGDGPASTEPVEGSSPVAPASAPAEVTVEQWQVRSRQDVVRALDKLCAYYAREVPESPVPLLLARARRMATMNFMELLQDLAPESVREVERVAGAPLETES